MDVVMFGGMCRYDDASGLMWWNIRFEADGSAFEITFNKRNNSQYRQGSKVLVSALPLAAACPVILLKRKDIRGPRRGQPRTDKEMVHDSTDNGATPLRTIQKAEARVDAEARRPNSRRRGVITPTQQPIDKKHTISHTPYNTTTPTCMPKSTWG